MKKISIAFIILIIIELFSKFYFMLNSPITNEITVYIKGEQPIYHCNIYCVIDKWINLSILLTVIVYVVYCIIRYFLAKKKKTEKINQPQFYEIFISLAQKIS